MLILTRRPTQTVKIGSDVTLTILEIRGSQVRLGVSTAGDTTVRRGGNPRQGPGARPMPDGAR